MRMRTLFILICLLTLSGHPVFAISKEDANATSYDTSYYQKCGSGSNDGQTSSGPTKGGVQFDDSNSQPHSGQTDIDTDGVGPTSVGRGSSGTSFSNGGHS